MTNMDQNKIFELQKSFFDKLDKKLSILFDIGANVGDITNEYATLIPDAEIFCFEPIPKTFELLKKRYDSTSRIHCHQLAIGDINKNVTMFETALSGSSSLLPPTSYITESKNSAMAQGVTIVNSHNVKQITLDSFCKENNISHIDILKMDMQGSELNGLKGASSLLDEKKIDLIYTEVLFSDLYENQCYYHDIASFLHKKNYKLFDLVFSINSDDGKLYYGDAIFLSPALMKLYPTFV